MDKFFEQRKNNKLTTSQVGSLNELLVCADLISKGYHVYRSVCPDGLFDMLVYKDKEIKTVEVKTGYIKENGELSYFQQKSHQPKADIRALVTQFGIRYLE